MNWQDKVADKITAYVGSMMFVYVHVAWFIFWVVLNVFALKEGWDPYPFNFLTMVVSLEAIFLSTFVLISQNRQSVRDDIRDQRDLEVDTKAEQEIQRILEKLEVIESELKKR
jgi:uncharacterized membrane protein